MKKILLSIAGLLAFASVGLAADIPLLGPANSAAVERYAKEYIAHPDGAYILKGILWVESKNGRYKKGNGSYGIAQLEITTARYVAEKYGFDLPEEDKDVEDALMVNDAMNIKIAAAYLGLLEKTFSSLDNVIVAYNLGPTRLRAMAAEAGGVPTGYLRKVMVEVVRHKTVATASAEAPSSTLVEQAAHFGASLTRALAKKASFYAGQCRGLFSGKQPAVLAVNDPQYRATAPQPYKEVLAFSETRRFTLSRSRYAGALTRMSG